MQQKFLIKICEKFAFSKGLTHDFGEKLENPSEFVSLSRKPWFDL